MTTEDDIVYRNKKYPVRIITLSKREGTRRISTTKLSTAVMNDEGTDYRDKAGRVLDEGIYWYADEEEWKLSDAELIKVIKESE